MKILRIDDIPSPDYGDEPDWKPLRAELGLTAFGASAYVGNRGDALVAKHGERSGAGAGEHEELYVLVRGRATFTLEGEEVDVRPGTVVLALPGEDREARAEEDGTMVVVVGAPAGAAYEVAPWEYGFRARRARLLGEVDELERVTSEGTARYGDHFTMLFGRACVAAQRGRKDEALELLNAAVEQFDGLREWARDEPMLEPIRDDGRFPA